MSTVKEKKFDWFMLLLVVPVALLGAFVLWEGVHEDDTEAWQKTEAVDSMKTLEDSAHYYEDGLYDDKVERWVYVFSVIFLASCLVFYRSTHTGVAIISFNKKI